MHTPKWQLYAYLPTGAGAAVREYGAAIQAISFSTMAPGGFGDLKATLLVPDARIIPDELRPFSRVALFSGAERCFLGRWDEPATEMSNQGDILNLSALGANACLADDPQDSSYSAQTVQAIIAAEIAKRSAYLPLDADASQILPDNPAATFIQAFAGQSLDQLLNTTLPWLGDYTWGVWDHPVNLDVFGKPTWQLYYHVRDLSTISYSANFPDVDDIQVTPSLEYTYNVVTILYHDTTSNTPASVTVRDSRLNSDLSQGNAPFPMRRLRKDLSNVNLSSTQATTLANALLSDYQNGNYKITLRLNRLRDAGGSEIALPTARADRNLMLPEFAQYGIQLPFAPTPGINVWYITETQYDEQQNSTPLLTLTLDSFADQSAFQFARLQYQAQLASTNVKVGANVKQPGLSEIGYCGVGWGANGLGGDVFEQGVNFKTEMTNTPSSITLASSTSSNVLSFTAATITTKGFTLRVTSNVNGAGTFRGTYKTNGN